MSNVTQLFAAMPAQPKAADFEAFWAVYPRRKDKLEALRAWKKALRHASAEAIIAAAARYAQEADPSFTKLPATWLNKGSFLDEDDPQPAVVDPIESRLSIMAKMVKESSSSKFCADWVRNNVSEADLETLRERGMI